MKITQTPVLPLRADTSGSRSVCTVRHCRRYAGRHVRRRLSRGRSSKTAEGKNTHRRSAKIKLLHQTIRIIKNRMHKAKIILDTLTKSLATKAYLSMGFLSSRKGVVVMVTKISRRASVVWNVMLLLGIFSSRHHKWRILEMMNDAFPFTFFIFLFYLHTSHREQGKFQWCIPYFDSGSLSLEVVHSFARLVFDIS